MNKYKQPTPQEDTQATLETPKYLNDNIGSLFLDINDPTTTPSGSPTKFINQIQYTLVELAPVASTALVTGKIYKVTSVGTSNFTLVGAKKNELNQFFVATGTTAGTGSATEYSVRANFYIPYFNVWRYEDLS